MNTTELLAKQTEDAYDWVNRLISSIPYRRWDTTPEVMETNVSWQVGHLIMSFYYHSIMVIRGHHSELIGQLPLREYNELFTSASPAKAVGKTDPETLQSQLILVEQKSVEVIRSLPPEDLDKALEPTPMPHPIAKTRFEALDWNIKHTMWHCGQLGILKRVVDKRYDFGLRRPG